MNKQKTRYTARELVDFRMPINEFCLIYGRDLKVVMHRLNISNWFDYDALIVPTELGDTTPDKIRRVLTLIEYHWSDAAIAKHLSVPEAHVGIIKNLSEYEKQIYSDKSYFLNYFRLNPAKIDAKKIFHPVSEKSAV